MKKLLSIALAFAMVLSLSITVFAAGDEDSNSGTISEDAVTISPDPDKEYNPEPGSTSTSVKFSVAPTYTITIPAKVELEREDSNGTVTYEQEASITASAGVRLLNGQTIQITLSAGEDGFVLTTDQAAALNYTVTVGGGESATTIQSGDTVASFGTSTDEQTSTLYFAANDPTYAGEYSDTVVFTISIVSPASNGSGEPTEP